jgi:DNA polymerase-1
VSADSQEPALPDRLLLIDGSSFLYRAFHALPDLRTRTGLPTGALTGMVNMLRRVRAEWPARYVACIFDPRGPTFRDAIYSEYKANRASMPEDLAAQVPAIFEAVKALGWPFIVIDGVEADDVIGTLAVQASERNLPTVVVTGDKDLTQLVNDHVVLIDTMSRDGGPAKVSDRAAVIEKFGVGPASIADWLGLVGDTADGFPGLPGWGAKSAASVLAKYLHIENIPDDEARWAADGVVVRGATKLAATLREKRELANLFKVVATVVTNVEDDVQLGSVDDWEWRGPTKELAHFGQLLGMSDLVERTERAMVGRN